MRFLRRFFIRLSNLTTGRRAGMSPAEARRQAALKLGAAQAIREQHNAEQGLPLAENLLFDIRYAFRMLYRSPLF